VDCCGGPCELLLLEAGSLGSRIVREPRVRGSPPLEADTRQILVKTQQTEKT
jgi:hypothetical protein